MRPTYKVPYMHNGYFPNMLKLVLLDGGVPIFWCLLRFPILNEDLDYEFETSFVNPSASGEDAELRRVKFRILNNDFRFHQQNYLNFERTRNWEDDFIDKVHPFDKHMLRLFLDQAFEWNGKRMVKKRIQLTKLRIRDIEELKKKFINLRTVSVSRQRNNRSWAPPRTLRNPVAAKILMKLSRAIVISKLEERKKRIKQNARNSVIRAQILARGH